MLPTKKNQNWFPSIFNDFIGSDWVERLHSSSPINIIETDADFKVEIAAPGLTKDDFNIKVTNDNLLTVSVKQEQHKEEKDKKGSREREHVITGQFLSRSVCSYIAIILVRSSSDLNSSFL